MADEKANGRNKGNVVRPIGYEVTPFRSPTEGADAHGRPTVLVKDESPTRIDMVNEFFYYLGWAEYGADEAEDVWKIRRIQRVGTVWEQKYAMGEQFFNWVWDNRSDYPYL